MKGKIKEFLKDESGQTSTEYILLVAVVAFIIFKFKGVLETKLMGLTEGVFGKADQLLESINTQ
jgi:pilus assembly protein Flp/PilA